MKIILTGGGSGGHVTPLIAIAREIRRLYPRERVELIYLGPKDDFGSVMLDQEGIKVRNILAGKLRRYFTPVAILSNFLDIFKIPLGIIQAFVYLFFSAPDMIFCKGGFGSLPVAIAGRILFIPVFLHESDIVPGRVSRFISKFAVEIFVSFPRTNYFPPRKMVVVGNPIRKDLIDQNNDNAKGYLGIRTRKPVIFIIGGSQGAQRINDKILQVLPAFLEEFEIIHQCGEKNYRQVNAESKILITPDTQDSYHLFSFLKEPEIGFAYAASDLVIARSGSGTIFEIAAFGKPSVLIPLPESAQNHQVKNAYAYAETGTSQVIEEANFSANFFLERVRFVFSNSEELVSMSTQAQRFAKPDAGRIIANYLVDYLI